MLFLLVGNCLLKCLEIRLILIINSCCWLAANKNIICFILFYCNKVFKRMLPLITSVFNHLSIKTYARILKKTMTTVQSDYTGFHFFEDESTNEKWLYEDEYNESNLDSPQSMYHKLEEGTAELVVEHKHSTALERPINCSEPMPTLDHIPPLI